MSENSKLVVYQVNIALIENPKIWRMINIPQNYTLSDLHISIQSAMGWTNVHMYEFKIFNINSNRETIIGIPDDEYPSAEGFLDSRTTNVSDIFDENTRNAKYIYDFGDYWEHYIEIKKTYLKYEYILLPICNGGNGTCPTEDIGGIDGYNYQKNLNNKFFLKMNQGLFSLIHNIKAIKTNFLKKMWFSGKSLLIIKLFCNLHHRNVSFG